MIGTHDTQDQPASRMGGQHSFAQTRTHTITRRGQQESPLLRKLMSPIPEYRTSWRTGWLSSKISPPRSMSTSRKPQICSSSLTWIRGHVTITLLITTVAPSSGCTRWKPSPRCFRLETRRVTSVSFYSISAWSSELKALWPEYYLNENYWAHVEIFPEPASRHSIAKSDVLRSRDFDHTGELGKCPTCPQTRD